MVTTPTEDYTKTSLGWQEANLKISTKKSGLKSLHHNRAQVKVHNTMRLQIAHDLPVMLLILKARQRGISTYIEATIFEDVNRRPNRHACVVSADNKSTRKVFRMFQTFQQEMPENLRRETDRSNAQEIIYSKPWRSSMLCNTAGQKILGRGGTTEDVHATEVAFWANAKTQLNSLLQEVPEEPDTMVVQETTANGVGGSFYDEYWRAVRRLQADPHDYSGYLPIFLSWQDEEEYQTQLPARCHEVPNLTSEMQEYVRDGLSMGVSLTPEQIYFAQLKVQNKCGGDYSLFMQEYPRTAREAFQSTGRMVFKTVMLDQMEKHCKPAAAYVEFYMDGTDVKYRHVNRRVNCWSVWKWPIKGHGYVEFGDPAEGVLSDSNDPKSEADRSVGGILDRKDFDVPITYYGRPDTIEFGDQLVMAAKYYNYAWASPEMNSIGQSHLDTFKRANYPFIYDREFKEEEIQREDSKKLGWKTTMKSRKPMIADLSTVIDEQELRLYDVRFIAELRVFITNSRGKPEAEKGEHDDCVICLAGLIQLNNRCPINEDLSWADEPKPKVEPMSTISIAGAYDRGMDHDEDEVDESMFETMKEFEG